MTSPPTSALQRYVAKLRHPLLCPQTELSPDKSKPCICERGVIDAELSALVRAAAEGQRVRAVVWAAIEHEQQGTFHSDMRLREAVRALSRPAAASEPKP